MTAPVTSIEHLGRHVGQTVTLRGWVHNRTSKGKLHFLMLRDGTGYVQCVMHKAEIGDALFDAIGGLGQESSLSITGPLSSPRSRSFDRSASVGKRFISSSHSTASPEPAISNPEVVRVTGTDCR